MPNSAKRNNSLQNKVPPPFRFTVPAKIHSPMVLKVEPDSICTLHLPDETDQSKSLKLFADEDGNIRFHVKPFEESEKVAEIAIDCDVKGKVTRYMLHLRSNSKATDEMPFHTPESPLAVIRGAKLRPALMKKEAFELAEEDLLKRGYPPRPDAEKAPEMFKMWLRAVTSESTTITPKIISRPEITHGHMKTTAGPATSGNWSGFEQRCGPYNAVYGSWVVPYVTGEPGKHDYSCCWVGIDGDGTNDLVQAGTEQETISILWFNFTNYYAWTEFLPQQATEQMIANQVIHPGDQIMVYVYLFQSFLWLCPGPCAVFFIENISTQTNSAVITPYGGTTVNATEAEWIVERPTVSGSLPDLADYGSLAMSGCARAVNNNNWYTYWSSWNLIQITMMNSTDTLSTVQSQTTGIMIFFWHKFL